MNALELADLLLTTESTNNQAATMLRQQQAEIEKLMCLVNIQKAVSRDVDIDFLNETVDRQQAEIQAAIELVKKFQAERSALKAKIDEMAGDIMTLENQIGTMTGYGHN
jgi:predicted RNase H-like nuclease (RuvC/YqgF family)